MNLTVLEIVQEIFDADTDTIQDDHDLRDLAGWDSLNHMMFIAKIEKEYGIVLSGDEIAEMLNIASVRRILETNHKIRV